MSQPMSHLRLRRLLHRCAAASLSSSSPKLQSYSLRFFSNQSWLSVPGKPLIKWPNQPSSPGNRLPKLSSNPNPEPTPNPAAAFSHKEFATISELFMNPRVFGGLSLHTELDRTGIEPSLGLLWAVFDHFDSSPKLLHSLFLWAVKRPEFRCSPELFESMVNVLAKSREFDSAWSLILERLGKGNDSGLVSEDTFVIMIRRYARAGMVESAVRTFEYAKNLNSILSPSSEMSLFEILLDSLCKEGKVRSASDYFDAKRKSDPKWVPSTRVYNILLNGWFRSRKLKRAEQLWTQMRNDNARPTVVTYGTLVEGYCRIRRPERAIELVSEMRAIAIEPNAIVFNPIIDALAEAGRFKEALGMMERFLVLESGPTISTYNCLVKGFCKSGDLVGASKMLRTMIGRGFVPTPTTYNYFFRYFSKLRKIEEGMNLYTKMIESGHSPDRLTYHLLLKMLCEEGKVNLAVQVSKEMRSRGCDMDLATGTMMIHLYCNVHRFDEAFAEFEDLMRKGIVPQQLTFQRLSDELKQRGMVEMAQKLGKLMSSVQHSTELPNTYAGDLDSSRARRFSIIRKAEAMAVTLKTCNNPRKLVKLRGLSENVVSVANRLIEDIKKNS